MMNNPSARFLATIHKLQSSTYVWNSIQKSKSPKLKSFLNNLPLSALLDSGAEINVLDAETARAAKLGIIDTHETAQAANKLPLDIRGQTEADVILKCPTNEGVKMLNLGIMLIVNQLGIPCLIGQPGIEENNIICLPKKKIIILAGHGTVHHTPYASSECQFSLARAVQSSTLLPGDQISYQLPADMAHASTIAVTPKENSLLWLKPSVQNVHDGKIYLTNSSSTAVKIKKSGHIAEIRDTVPYQVANALSSSQMFQHPDTFQYKDLAKSRCYSKDFLHQLQVDPDEILSHDERQIFHELHRKYVNLFTTQPGKYNGKFGYVDNKLQFATPPAPNSKPMYPTIHPP